MRIKRASFRSISIAVAVLALALSTVAPAARADPRPAGGFPAQADLLKAIRATKPRISGTARVGRTLTAKPGTWTTRTRLSYRWLRNGRTISKATKSKYTLAPSDLKKKISVKVTGKKPGYKTVSKTSAAVTVATPCRLRDLRYHSAIPWGGSKCWRE